MRVPVSRPVQVTNSNVAEELKRRSEEVVGVGEEEFGAAEDEAAGVFGGGEEVVGEEVEDGGDICGVYGGCEEVGRVVDEAGDIGVGEGMRFEESDGGEDVVDGVGEREVVGFGVGVDYS